MAVADSALRFDLLLRDKTGAGAKSASSNFSKLAKVGLTLGAVGAVIGSTINKAAQFDKTIRVAGAAANAAGDDLKNMSKLALEMGTSTQFGAQGAADAMLELAKAGISVADQKAGVLVETMKLASAGGLELGDAATYMTNALNTFGLKATDAAQVSTALAGGAAASTASVESLGLALSQVGPGAKNAGLSLQETVGVLAAFDNAGIKGSDAGTSFKTMLTRLVPTTKKASKEMKRLGLDFTDANGKFDSITVVAQKLQDKLKGLSAEQRSTALSTIFGSDATRAATVLLNDGAKGLEKYIQSAKDRSQVEKLAAAQTEGAAGNIKKFKAAIDSLQIALAIGLLPAISDLIGALAGFVTKIATKVQPAIAGLADLLDAKIGPAFSRAKDAVSGAFDGIDFSGVGMQLGKDAEGWTTDMIDGIKKGFDTGDWSGVGKSVGSGVSNALANTGGLAVTLTAWIGQQIEKIKWGDLGVKMGKMAPTLLLGLTIGLLNFDIGSLLSTLGDNWFEAILGVLTIAFLPSRMIGAVSRLLGKIPLAGRLLAWVVEAVHSAAGGIASAGGDLLANFARGIGTGISKVFPEASAKFTGAISKLVYELRFKALLFVDTAASWGRALLSGLASFPGKLAGKAGELIGGLLGGLARGAVKLDAWAGGLGARLVRAVGDLSSALYGAGRDFIFGFIRGMDSLAGSVIGKAKDLAGKAGGAIKGALGIGSPSKLMITYGRWFSEGFAIGIKDKADDVTSAAGAIIDRLKEKIDTARNFAKDIQASFTPGLTGIDTMIPGVGTADPTEGGITKLLEGLRKKAADAKKFADTIRALRKQGLDVTALDELRGAGPEGGLKASQQILAGGQSAVDQVNALTKQINQVGQQFANRETKSEFGYGINGPSMATLKGGGQPPVQIHFDLASGGGDKFIQAIREAIRVKGGNVQIVLGSK